MLDVNLLAKAWLEEMGRSGDGLLQDGINGSGSYTRRMDLSVSTIVISALMSIWFTQRSNGVSLRPNLEISSYPFGNELSASRCS